jgi:RNA 2',3'-cyclic 3'-phosphodiesterase
MIRAFLALEIPDDVLTKIISIRDEWLGGSENIRWEPKEKLHLTLKFLGNTKEELLEKYSDTIERIVLNYDCLDLSFSEFGVFRMGDEPKILWMGLRENEKLIKIVNEIESSFTEYGFEKEKRKFRSHITLLRFRGYEDSKKILSLIQVNLPEIKFIANKITFFESKLLQSGSVYKSLKSFYLKN